MFKEKYNQGKKLRNKTPRNSHAHWKVPKKRFSVESMIEKSNYDRLPDLIPIRHFRMTGSPFIFYRATASLMARDLSYTPSSGIKVQACGDCHLMNFGVFATPERALIADINDFDETNPGPWEWDLKRLATSFMLACREKNFSEKEGRNITMELVSSYQNKLSEYSQMNFLELWYTKFTLEDIRKMSSDKRVQDAVETMLEKASTQSHDRVLYKITQKSLSHHEISNQPPLVYHPIKVKESMEMINQFMGKYKNTLQPDRKKLLDQYRVIDVALKVVGVGSVGTRCYVVLLMNHNDEPIFVQVKEARQSVLEPYTEKSVYSHQGERVVQGQRIIQAASDIFLGWSMGPAGRHFYLRQLRDKKISFEVESYKKFGLTIYARLCGYILAHAHCKSAQGPLICGYIGKGEEFAEAIVNFAAGYADQTEKDYEDFMKAIKKGKLAIKEEIVQ
ncbi:MAG: DUF2252 domain-containing protein [Bacteroidetes bacterium]|nr:MAG: DUF2252 domain-containing protein [Bacteroidota bacterium]